MQYKLLASDFDNTLVPFGEPCPRPAVVKAVNEAFPTVMTSGTIMTVAGFLIAYRVSDVYIGHIGLAVGRGALISVILVMTVLPQLIVLLDKVIEKTTFEKKAGD